MDDLDRVYQRLVQNIKTRTPDQLTLPFTVAELYEQLIPYRHNRRELGIETNQDYEIAVMRLLSGERDYITGDDAMQDALKQELASKNPDTGAFREFATTQISLSPAALSGKGDRSEAAAAAPVAAAAPPAPGSPPQPTARPPRPSSPGVPEDTGPKGCRYCGGVLPEGKTITFCPHCGQNLALNQCPACGTEMEQGWKFCIGCGRPNR